jgi:hypothetical protein
MGRTKKNHAVSREAKLEQRKAILAALARVSSEEPATASASAGDENGDYYTLTREEISALLSGNLEKIEHWVSNLDRRHATWLLRWLIKEST